MFISSVIAASGVAGVAQAAPVTDPHVRGELGFAYDYVHSNAPPGSCGCFSLNGGSATFAWNLGKRGLALAGDVLVTQAGAIANGNSNLTLSTYTGGVRYWPLVGRSRLQPFGEALVGLAHASGSLVTGGPTSNADASFATNLGGGLDLRTSSRISIRVVDADYLFTGFDNGGNNHQNNIRIGAGLVVHF
jgi:peptidoglycan-associated lipoprotein